MFSRGDPSADALARVLNDFGAADELLVLVSLPGSGDVSPADTQKLEHFGDRLAAEINHDPQTGGTDGWGIRQAG